MGFEDYFVDGLSKKKKTVPYEKEVFKELHEDFTKSSQRKALVGHAWSNFSMRNRAIVVVYWSFIVCLLRILFSAMHHRFTWLFASLVFIFSEFFVYFRH